MAVKQQQGAAVALIEVAEAVDRLESLESIDPEILETASLEIKELVSHLLAETAETVRELRSTTRTLIQDADASRGIRVSTTSMLLEVSEPTVRDWLRRGILVPIHGSKPVQVELESVARVRRVLRDLRRRASEDPDWRRNLVDAIHDAITLSSPSVQAGLKELASGELGREL